MSRGVWVTDPLVQRSIEVLRDGQARSGAFVASPSFPVYRYAWLRDGSFCAVALDAAGEREAAHAFHSWVGRSILEHRSFIEAAISRLAQGDTPPPEVMPPARYTVDGALEDDDGGAEPWPNFQIDGYGIWLWALAGHVRNGLDQDARDAALLVARYLQAAWNFPCFNCWEEYDGGEHASTLGAAVAGLDAAARLLDGAEHAGEAARIRAHLRANFVDGDRFKRGRNDERLDGSLLWLAVPFGAFSPDDAHVRATVDEIRSTLTGPTGGVYRYRGDTYYGGGEWLLLTSSLAWHDAVTGNRAGLDASQQWVRSHARANGDLPEQVAEHAQDPSMIPRWVSQWGDPATPLLWSHAMYLIAEAAAAERR